VTIVDARGLLCPVPLTMAKRKMAELPAGETLTVLATDPEATIDIAAWAADEGHLFTEHALDGWSEYTLAKSG
jgi:tRNA 2-thiouridine synthesizing protein A